MQTDVREISHVASIRPKATGGRGSKPARVNFNAVAKAHELGETGAPVSYKPIGNRLFDGPVSAKPQCRWQPRPHLLEHTSPAMRSRGPYKRQVMESASSPGYLARTWLPTANTEREKTQRCSHPPNQNSEGGFRCNRFPHSARLCPV